MDVPLKHQLMATHSIKAHDGWAALNVPPSHCYVSTNIQRTQVWSAGLTFDKVYTSLRFREQGHFLFLQSQRQASGDLSVGPYQHTVPASSESFKKSWLTLTRWKTSNIRALLYERWRKIWSRHTACSITEQVALYRIHFIFEQIQWSQ